MIFLPPRLLLIVKKTATNPDRIKISFDVVPLFMERDDFFCVFIAQKLQDDDLDVCETIPKP